ncbi:MAG: class I SAM-dependent methyltransferase [Ginsengibacter sp.]
MSEFKKSLFRIIFLSKIGRVLLNRRFNKNFSSAADYWEKRYSENGYSGEGSYGKLALYKSSVINEFVRENQIAKIVDFGCGDGNQLKMLCLPDYIGLDVSNSAVERCRQLFANDRNKKFFVYYPTSFTDDRTVIRGDLGLSLDVIYHLLEDEIFEGYMHRLFSSSTRFIIIYAWDVDGPRNGHVMHRKFTKWIDDNYREWELREHKKSQLSEAADFFIYEKCPGRI